ncbi:MAG TPA: hypothetical protein VFG94_05865 [Acidimicrobiales bacterium]|nr:hypothetical protein [Acidimicrobiales bacterium]
MSGSIVSFPGTPRRRVVVSFPLSRSAAESLQRSVGATIELVDIREADGTESLVVVSSVSRDLLGKLRTAFPEATVLVVEVEDATHRLDLGGPVMRALDAGAHGYLVARSVDELGDAITRASAAGEQALADEAMALPAAADDQLDEVLDAIIRDRLRAREPRVE